MIKTVIGIAFKPNCNLETYTTTIEGTTSTNGNITANIPVSTYYILSAKGLLASGAPFVAIPYYYSPSYDVWGFHCISEYADNAVIENEAVTIEVRHRKI